MTIPSLRQLAPRALPITLEGTVVPLVLFLVFLNIAGLAAAVVAGFGWSSIAIVRRLVRHERVPGMMLIGAMFLIIRSALALATGSIFLYFVQPTVGAACVGMAFLISVAIRKPLARRFAGDFCTIPDHLYEDARVHSYFQRCSMMWAAVGFTNTAVTLWLLLSQPTATFLVAKTALSICLTIGAVATSVVWFRRSMDRHGLVLAV